MSYERHATAYVYIASHYNITRSKKIEKERAMQTLVQHRQVQYHPGKTGTKT